MNIQPDFEELFELLNKHHVEYLVVGGYAVAFHGFPRFTKDIDIFFNHSDKNAENLGNALLEFGFGKADVDVTLFKKKGNIITFGVEPVRVDLMNRIDGVEFDEARTGKVSGKYGRATVDFIGRDHLIKNKSSTSRLKDKADVEELG